MIVGVWKIKGWFLKILRIGMIFDLAPEQGDGVNAMRALYFFGAFYLTFYNEGNDHCGANTGRRGRRKPEH